MPEGYHTLGEASGGGGETAGYGVASDVVWSMLYQGIHNCCDAALYFRGR